MTAHVPWKSCLRYTGLLMALVVAAWCRPVPALAADAPILIAGKDKNPRDRHRPPQPPRDPRSDRSPRSDNDHDHDRRCCEEARRLAADLEEARDQIERLWAELRRCDRRLPECSPSHPCPTRDHFCIPPRPRECFPRH